MAFDSAISTPLIAGSGERLITLTRGLVALIDESDWPLVEGRMWYAHKARSNWYARSDKGRGDSGAVYLHRLIMDAPEGLLVDHENQNSLDCRRSNLILCGRSKNGQNAIYQTSTGHRGVREERGRWRARINIAGVRLNLGLYDTPEDAAAAYDAAALKHFGSSAWTNEKQAARIGRPSTSFSMEDIPFD